MLNVIRHINTHKGFETLNKIKESVVNKNKKMFTGPKPLLRIL